MNYSKKEKRERNTFVKSVDFLVLPLASGSYTKKEQNQWEINYTFKSKLICNFEQTKKLQPNGNFFYKICL